MGDNEDRARRLAEALRENLRRRKAQARGAPGDAAAPPGEAIAPSASPVPTAER